jgi:hypothetical protein
MKRRSEQQAGIICSGSKGEEEVLSHRCNIINMCKLAAMGAGLKFRVYVKD